MDANIYPCIIYQRLRPSAPEASEFANRTVWPLADELAAHKGYTICGLYGDSEYAPPFCGGDEIRPAFQRALRLAKKTAAKHGNCALIIGDASAIGGGDPFLPPYEPTNGEQDVDVRVANFHLRPHAISTPLRSAWRYFDLYREVETRRQADDDLLELVGSSSEIEVIVRRDPKRLLAGLYVTNPSGAEVTLIWKQLLRRRDHIQSELPRGNWRRLVVPSGRAMGFETIFQGELPWVRQLRFRYNDGDRRIVGSMHLTPADMIRDRLPLIWEGRE